MQLMQGPHRLVVRTSRRGRDNPGSTPGVDTLLPLPPSAFQPILFSCRDSFQEVRLQVYLLGWPRQGARDWDVVMVAMQLWAASYFFTLQTCHWPDACDMAYQSMLARKVASCVPIVSLPKRHLWDSNPRGETPSA